MEFFTADDILNHGVGAAPDEPVTVASDASIQRALTVMLENDYDQLPVVSDDEVEGTVTYESVARYVKSIEEPRVADTSIRIALTRPPSSSTATGWTWRTATSPGSQTRCDSRSLGPSGPSGGTAFRDARPGGRLDGGPGVRGSRAPRCGQEIRRPGGHVDARKIE